MASLNSYLHFNGNAAQAFEFYKSVFGTEYSRIMRFKDVPPPMNGSKGEEEKITHVSLPIGGGTILMGGDVPDQFGKVTQGTNSWIYVGAESEEEAQRIYNGLLPGGQTRMPLDKTFWGAYFGMLIDQFGVQWMISYEYQQQQG